MALHPIWVELEHECISVINAQVEGGLDIRVNQPSSARYPGPGAASSPAKISSLTLPGPRRLLRPKARDTLAILEWLIIVLLPSPPPHPIRGPICHYQRSFVEENIEVCPKVSQGASKGMEGASYSCRLVLKLEMAGVEGKRRRLLVRGEHVDRGAVSRAWYVLCKI